jgi:anoctamin-10
VVFTEYWNRQEEDLAIRWGVRGVSRIDEPRRQFTPDKVEVDPVTGETIRYFPTTTRLYRQMLHVPFALSVVLLQGCLIATCFGIEVFISEVYDGPMKSVLVRYKQFNDIWLTSHRYTSRREF